MPVGPYVRRFAENDFVAEKSEQYMIAFHWLDYLIEKRGKAISHYLNAGRETRILGYRVDGFEAPTADAPMGTIYEFHGESNIFVWSQ